MRKKMAEEGRRLISRSENDYNVRACPFRRSSQEYAVASGIAALGSLFVQPQPPLQDIQGWTEHSITIGLRMIRE